MNNYPIKSDSLISEILKNNSNEDTTKVTNFINKLAEYYNQDRRFMKTVRHPPAEKLMFGMSSRNVPKSQEDEFRHNQLALRSLGFSPDFLRNPNQWTNWKSENKKYERISDMPLQTMSDENLFNNLRKKREEEEAKYTWWGIIKSIINENLYRR